jgi:glycosyltransferase involved in cell wall biosynthesis
MTPAVLAIAGVGRYTTELAGALARTPGVELERLGFPGLGDGDPVRRRATRVARSLAYYPVTLSRQAARRRVELVHCPGPVAALRTGLPLVLTIHDMLPWRYPEMFGRVAVARQRLLVGRVARSADRILVGAEYTRRDVVEYLDVSPRRVEVVPHGVDARFTPRQTDPLRLAHRFGIPPGPFVLWVGTLEPRKNLASLLRAFALVRRRAPETSLVLVGEWGLADAEVERDLDQLGRSVIRPGFVTDEELSILYSATTCFVFPSLYEGFGLPPLEAMACGAPVIASDRSSMPEVVGDGGLLVDPTDTDALADAIESVVLSPERAAELRRAGLARAREFTWARTASLTVATYRAALADPH